MSQYSLDQPIKLVCGPEQREMVSFPNGLRGEARFDPSAYYLELALKNIGIFVPKEERERFPEMVNQKEKRAIFPSDPSFGKAFYEIYFKNNMDLETFVWVKI